MRRILSALLLLLPILTYGQELLPPYVDNSTNKYFPPLIDQAGGSCAQASSIGYVFTYEMNRYLDRDASSPANRFSYQFIWNLVNDGIDQGGFAEDGLFVAMRSGAMTEEDFSTIATSAFTWPSGFEKYHNALRYRVSRFVNFSKDVDTYKRYLAGSDGKPGGVLSFSGHCFGWEMMDDYSGPSGTGYKALVTKLPNDGSHAMTIVGYDDLVSYKDKYGTQHDGAFIVVNSWGARAHDNGHYYYPYDFFRETLSPRVISEDAITAEVKYQEPKILFKLTIEYTSRDDLAYNIGATDKAESRVPDNFYYQSGMSNKGGDHYMRGTYDKKPLEFALDLTDNIPSSDPDYCRYFLKIVRTVRGRVKGEGSLHALSVIDYRSGKPVEYKYRGKLPQEIKDGDNWFVISLVPLFRVSCSPVRVSENPLYLKTASGEKATLRISGKGAATKINYTLKKK